jgi:hypothetical protein
VATSLLAIATLIPSPEEAHHDARLGRLVGKAGSGGDQRGPHVARPRDGGPSRSIGPRYGDAAHLGMIDVLTKLVNLWPASRIDELVPWAYAAKPA